MSEARLEVKQTQKLSQAMTTALRLLSFDLQEMSEYMNRQIQDNPSLEYVPPRRSPQDFARQVRIHYSAAMDDPDRDPDQPEHRKLRDKAFKRLEIALRVIDPLIDRRFHGHSPFRAVRSP